MAVVGEKPMAIDTAGIAQQRHSLLRRCPDLDTTLHVRQLGSPRSLLRRYASVDAAG